MYLALDLRTASIELAIPNTRRYLEINFVVRKSFSGVYHFKT